MTNEELQVHIIRQYLYNIIINYTLNYEVTITVLTVRPSHVHIPCPGSTPVKTFLLGERRGSYPERPPNNYLLDSFHSHSYKESLKVMIPANNNHHRVLRVPDYRCKPRVAQGEFERLLHEDRLGPAFSRFCRPNPKDTKWELLLLPSTEHV